MRLTMPGSILRTAQVCNAIRCKFPLTITYARCNTFGMTLDQYLKSENIRRAAFAARVGTSGASITRICQGLQSPSPDLMREIIAASGGKVTLEELVFPKAAA